MSSADDPSGDREARLIAALAKLYAGEFTEGELLRTLRRDVLGLTQERYADLAGISRRTLSDLEGDKGNVTVGTMARAFRPLGLKVGLLPRHPELLERVFEDTPGRHTRLHETEHVRSLEEATLEILRVIVRESTYTTNLAEAIRSRAASFGGADLELPRREPMREPPTST